MADEPPPNDPNATPADPPAGAVAAADAASPVDPSAVAAADATAVGSANAISPADVAALDTTAPSTEPAAIDGSDTAAIDQAMIDELLKQASFDDPSAAVAAMSGGGDSGFGGSTPAEMPETERFNLPNFQQVIADAQVSSIELLRDVELNVKIELGRSRMMVEDVLKLAEGSVVELDKLAGDPVDVFVNDRLVARGEVLVLNENFCVRVNEIVAGVKDEGI